MPRKTFGIYDPSSDSPFRISRSKIDMFLECPRCFYMDQVCGVKRPNTPPFTLNNAVDTLLKKEFDIHRAKQSLHPLLKKYKIPCTPFQHKNLELWRDALKNGIGFHHEPTNLFVRGGIDDVWINDKEELHIVDYKATAKTTEISLDAPWQIAYKRQVEVYQWLFRQNKFKVSDIAYFVYVNGQVDREAFDGKLEFEVHLLPYEGNTDWIEKTLIDIKKCIDGTLPQPAPTCEYCEYKKLSAQTAMEFSQAKKTGKLL